MDLELAGSGDKRLNDHDVEVTDRLHFGAEAAEKTVKVFFVRQGRIWTQMLVLGNAKQDADFEDVCHLLEDIAEDL